jgi:hypothetical protein
MNNNADAMITYMPYSLGGRTRARMIVKKKFEPENRTCSTIPNENDATSVLKDLIIFDFSDKC